MPAIAAAPIFYAALASGAAATAGSVVAAKSASGSQKRATSAQQQAAAKAEAFERERNAKEEADHARLEAEDRRRWDTEQQNIAAQQAEKNQRQQMLDQRQGYEDKLRYRKMVNLARLTGGPVPDAPPPFGAPADGTYTPLASTYAAPGAPLLARPSTANQMIAAPGDFDPFAMPSAQPMFPLNALGRRRTF